MRSSKRPLDLRHLMAEFSLEGKLSIGQQEGSTRASPRTQIVTAIEPAAAAAASRLLLARNRLVARESS